MNSDIRLSLVVECTLKSRHFAPLKRMISLGVPGRPEVFITSPSFRILELNIHSKSSSVQNLDARGNSLARADQIPPGGLPAGPAPPGRTPLPPSRRRPSDTPGSPSEPSAAGRLGSGGARERLRNGRQAVPKKAYSATMRRCRTRPTNPICKKGRADFSPALSCPAVRLSQEPDALLILVEL